MSTSTVRCPDAQAYCAQGTARSTTYHLHRPNLDRADSSPSRPRRPGQTTSLHNQGSARACSLTMSGSFAWAPTSRARRTKPSPPRRGFCIPHIRCGQDGPQGLGSGTYTHTTQDSYETQQPRALSQLQGCTATPAWDGTHTGQSLHRAVDPLYMDRRGDSPVEQRATEDPPPPIEASRGTVKIGC